MYNLLKSEIDLIANAISVAQFESVLPGVMECEELKNLLDKLGICYDSSGEVILGE